MKSVGIIAEYNPFHHGHAYQIAKARECTDADVVIAIMSGNVVQRGEFAILDKWQRAEIALQNGVDLVVELPTLAAVQAADIFGYEAVRIAQALQIDALAFGAENPDKQLLHDVVCEMLQTINPVRFDQSYHEQQMAKLRDEEQRRYALTPNNQLAMAYVKAIYQLGATIDYVPIQRIGAMHTDTTLPIDHQIASGSAIREHVRQGNDVSVYVPTLTATYLQHAQESLFFWQFLKAELMKQTPEQLRAVYQVEEGIEYRLKEHVLHAADYAAFVQSVQTKRYKKARIQRVCLYIVCGITKDMVAAFRHKPIDSVRVLGCNDSGRAFLKEKNVAYVTQFNQKNVGDWAQQIVFDRLYQVFMQSQQEQNFRRIIRV